MIEVTKRDWQQKAALAGAVLALVAAAALFFHDVFADNTPKVTADQPETTQERGFSDQELSTAAQKFNDAIVGDQQALPEHLRGSTISFAVGDSPKPDDGSAGWRYDCSLWTAGGVAAESCEALVYDEPDGVQIIAITIDGRTYEL